MIICSFFFSLELSFDMEGLGLVCQMERRNLGNGEWKGYTASSTPDLSIPHLFLLFSSALKHLHSISSSVRRPCTRAWSCEYASRPRLHNTHCSATELMLSSRYRNSLTSSLLHSIDSEVLLSCKINYYYYCYYFTMVFEFTV